MEWEAVTLHSGLLKQTLQPGSFYKGWVAYCPWFYNEYSNKHNHNNTYVRYPPLLIICPS